MTGTFHVIQAFTHTNVGTLWKFKVLYIATGMPVKKNFMLSFVDKPDAEACDKCIVAFLSLHITGEEYNYSA